MAVARAEQGFHVFKPRTSRRGVTTMYSRLVVPLDGSEPCDQASPYGQGVASSGRLSACQPMEAPSDEQDAPVGWRLFRCINEG